MCFHRHRLAVRPSIARPDRHRPRGPHPPLQADGATTTESQLYLLGHAYTPERLLALSRGHWTVENNLHWVLDVTMSEDTSLVRRNHGPRNCATLKRVALNAVRIVTGKNFIRHIMRDALRDMRVLANILNHMPSLDAKAL